MIANGRINEEIIDVTDLNLEELEALRELK